MQCSKHKEVTLSYEFIFVFSPYISGEMLSKKSSHWWGVDVWKKYMNGWMAIEGGTGGGGGEQVKASARYGIWLLYVVKNCRRHSNICNRVEKIHFLLSHQKIENCHFLKTKHPSVNYIFHYSDTY